MEFVYNGSWHSSIKTSLFHALYGWEYLTPIFVSTPTSKIEGVNETIVVQYIYMQNAQKRAKFYANINQNPNFFEIIHKMLLKIKHIKNDLRLGKCPKLPP